jgi:L-asparaginase/Glu-tRNA(Gln) amidotransferase subunit D
MVYLCLGGGTISAVQDAENVRRAGGINPFAALVHEGLCFRGLALSDPITVYQGLSENISAAERSSISQTLQSCLAKPVSQGVLLTFGTDAMAAISRHLASCIDFSADNTPIIITGASHPIGSANSDALENLQLAIDSFGTLASGVYIAFGGQVIPGKYAAVEPYFGQGLRYSDRTSSRYKTLVQKKQDEISEAESCFFIDPAHSAHREVVMYPANSIQETAHEPLLGMAESGKLKSVVFILYHSGTASAAFSQSDIAVLVQKLHAMGVLCFGASESGEPVTLASYTTAIRLRQSGLVPLYSMDYRLAYSKAKYLIAHGVPASNMVQAMLTDCYGELAGAKINKEHIAELTDMYNNTPDDI